MAGTRGKDFSVITSEALAELRSRIGVPVRRQVPYIEVATQDAVCQCDGAGRFSALWW
jgi:hypothetical protein